ncbi:AMP-binding protein [Poseidonocella sp. HB161398]|uniref:AMP-binding protein n=1 Tax=Poseidonocella sp. HB161398 TaxID=2320855 RepID=UPI0011088AA5|nr:AMP-binding protein [Poseidonocella sp. HB161398]
MSLHACAGMPLEQARGATADALRRLLDLAARGAAFRAGHGAPWIGELPGTGHLDCVTSGSSGAPKAIRRSLASWQASFEVNRRLFGLAPPDRIATLGALGHSLALYGVMEALHLGLGTETLHGLRPDRQMARLAVSGASVLYATPTQLRLLSGAPAPGLRLVLCGGGALDPATRRQAAALFPQAEFREFYGASETSFIALGGPDTPEGAVGRAYPGVEIEIRRPVEGIGEVWVKSPYLFERYAEGESAETRREGGFLTVGELGRIDAGGFLWLAGRRGRMVTIADRNAYPEAVERLLAAHLDGRGAAVTAAPDPLRGHALTAWIEGAPDPRLEAELRHRIGAALGPHMVPRRFAWIARLPLLASGKPDLLALAGRAE